MFDFNAIRDRMDSLGTGNLDNMAEWAQEQRKPLLPSDR